MIAFVQLQLRQLKNIEFTRVRVKVFFHMFKILVYPYHTETCLNVGIFVH